MKSLTASPRVAVLVVDDHELVRDGVRLLLERRTGLTVVGTAATGDAALAAAMRLRPDVVVTDLPLAQCRGTDIIRIILQRLPRTHIVVLSAGHTSELVFRALQAGASGYMLKESAVDELMHAVDAALAGDHYLSGRIARMVRDGLLSDRASQSPIERLSARERQVLQLTVDGASSARIGMQMSLSLKTVETYRGRIIGKLQVSDRTQLMHFAIQHRLISLTLGRGAAPSTLSNGDCKFPWH